MHFCQECKNKSILGNRIQFMNEGEKLNGHITRLKIIPDKIAAKLNKQLLEKLAR